MERVLDDVDLAYSRFRPDSELTAVNAPAGRTVTVGPLLARAIEGSLEAARRTGGAVDPTVGRAMRLIGYDEDFDLLRPDRSLELRLEAVPGWSVVAFDAVRRTVRSTERASSWISGRPARASPPTSPPTPRWPPQAPVRASS